jgi:coenzyme F420-dependent glucose-6-phosphate dehydrogenase
MIELGYSLSSEEFSPTQLINFSKQAEDAGFNFSLISNHFHPWTNRQPHSAFVWSVLGGISQKTERLRVGTGVTCPIIRIHPAIIAQAAATSAVLMPRRFFLGVGTGESLNEHITGRGWPRLTNGWKCWKKQLRLSGNVERQLAKSSWQAFHD